MAYDYEELYSNTPDALGQPGKELVAYFEASDLVNARILDVGCGQGRDALFLARKGHRVVGVDLAPSGVRDMLEAAGREKLVVEGRVADITKFAPEGTFDVVLLDRTLHMLDEGPRLDTFARLLDHVSDGGRVLILDEKSNIAGFNRVLDAHQFDWVAEHAKRGTLFVRRGES